MSDRDGDNLTKEGMTKMLFEKELQMIASIYPSSAMDIIKKFLPKLNDIYLKWNNAFSSIGITDPRKMENDSFNEFAGFKRDKIVIGIAGPGAVGKNAFASELGFDRMINTTTRPRRANEIDGVNYHFLTEEKFLQMKSNNEFLTTTHRSGRGNYGLAKMDIADAFQKSSRLIVEENPETLSEIGRSLGDLMADFLLVYILPPYPVAPHLMARLAVRSAESGEDFENAIESTLGDRQIREFISTIEIKKKGIPLVYVVNDDLQRIAKKIKNILTSNSPR